MKLLDRGKEVGDTGAWDDPQRQVPWMPSWMLDTEILFEPLGLTTFETTRSHLTYFNAFGGSRTAEKL